MNSIAKNIDCMLGMSEYPDKYFELAIVDPEWGIEVNKLTYAKSDKIKYGKQLAFRNNYKFDWDNKPPEQIYFDELFRISKNQIIWGGEHFNLPVSRGWIVWDKDNGTNDFADCELAWTSFDMPIKKITYKWHGMLQENMKNKETRIHPCQKPIGLYVNLLNMRAKQGDKILDTHLGSGSSRIACYDYGFDFTGFELDKDYFEAQEKRFKDHTSQTNLFKVAL